MRRLTKLAVVGVATVSVVGGFTTIALASDRDSGPEQPITGPELERATTVALTAAGGGRVTETETGDEDAAYEVEVTKDDGTEVDIHLDAQFNVVVPPDEAQPDGEPGDDDGAGPQVDDADDANEPDDVDEANEPDDADEPDDVDEANEPEDADDPLEADDD